MTFVRSLRTATRESLGTISLRSSKRLPRETVRDVRQSGDISTRTGETRNDASQPHRVVIRHHDDGNLSSLHFLAGRVAPLPVVTITSTFSRDEFGGEPGHSCGFVVAVAVFEVDVLSFEEG